MLVALHAQQRRLGVEFQTIGLLVESRPGVVAASANLQGLLCILGAHIVDSLDAHVVDIVVGKHILILGGDGLRILGVDEHHRQSARIGCRLAGFLPCSHRPVVAAGGCEHPAHGYCEFAGGGPHLVA